MATAFSKAANLVTKAAGAAVVLVGLSGCVDPYGYGYGYGYGGGFYRPPRVYYGDFNGEGRGWGRGEGRRGGFVHFRPPSIRLDR